MKITVIIPTYNEEENIKILIPLLLEKFKIFKEYSFFLLIVDGNSKDKTVKVVKEYMQNHKNIYLIEEESKSGLGGAYIKGFNYAISKLHSDYVVEMDADLQHDPEDFPKLISKIKDGYDLIIGSRYVRGGSVPQEWAIYRKAISYFGSLFTRVVLRILKVKDFSSGFKVTKIKGVLDQIDFSLIKSKGFAYKFDMLIRIYDMKAKIVEVPIHFGLRDRGTSKMEKTNFRDSLRVVIEFAKERNKNFIKFLIVGFGGLFVDATIFTTLSFYIQPYYSAIFAGFVAMLFTFLLNNYFSFNDRRKEDFVSLLKFFFVYSVSSSVPILTRGYIIYFFVYELGDTLVIRYLGYFIGILIGLIWNFTIYSKVIWRKK